MKKSYYDNALLPKTKENLVFSSFIFKWALQTFDIFFIKDL